MKLVAVFSKFPTINETFILREAAALHAAGCEVHILSLKSSTDPLVQNSARELLKRTTYLPWLSVEILAAVAHWLWRNPAVVFSAVRFDLKGLFRSPRETFFNLAVTVKSMAYASRLRGIQFDYVHGFWATYAATSARVVGGLLGVPWGFSAHAHDIYAGNCLLDEKLREANLVLTCTAENESYLSKRVPEAAERIVLMHHGIDLRHFRRTPPPTSASPFRVLCVGSLVYRKGQHLLVKALAGLEREGIDWELTLVGDEGAVVSAGDSINGSEKKRVEEAIREYQVEDRVKRAGFVKEADMPPYYQACHVVALLAIPGLHFGLPNVLLEGMATARPFVATALPAIRESLADYGTGILVEGTSEEDIVAGAREALRRLAGDPNLRAAMGDKGPTFVTRHDIEHCSRELVRRFTAVAATGRRR